MGFFSIAKVPFYTHKSQLVVIFHRFPPYYISIDCSTFFLRAFQQKRNCKTSKILEMPRIRYIHSRKENVVSKNFSWDLFLKIFLSPENVSYVPCITFSITISSCLLKLFQQEKHQKQF